VTRPVESMTRDAHAATSAGRIAGGTWAWWSPAGAAGFAGAGDQVRCHQGLVHPRHTDDLAGVGGVGPEVAGVHRGHPAHPAAHWAPTGPRRAAGATPAAAAAGRAAVAITVTGAPPPVGLGSVAGGGVTLVGVLRAYHQFSAALTKPDPPWSRTHSTVRTCQLALP
jgi:hypothetical protein